MDGQQTGDAQDTFIARTPHCSQYVSNESGIQAADLITRSESSWKITGLSI
jgi:hypothetical protein